MSYKLSNKKVTENLSGKRMKQYVWNYTWTVHLEDPE